MKFQIGADIGHHIVFRDRLGVQPVDRGQPVDQRKMRARQRARGKLGFQQSADRSQFLDPFRRQFRGGDPARG